ncbi:hypothetical protein LJR029_003996 [Caballeronia sp. LjRoot29]|uniref:hypothetical protein n=1 Tax=Caballeronia sp. LjRoot29 TaxID=3342315 RepID=UPI003ECD918B
MRDMIRFAAGLTYFKRLNVRFHYSRGIGLMAELVDLGVTNIDTSLAGSGVKHPSGTGGQRRRDMHGRSGQELRAVAQNVAANHP